MNGFDLFLVMYHIMLSKTNSPNVVLLIVICGTKPSRRTGTFVFDIRGVRKH